MREFGRSRPHKIKDCAACGVTFSTKAASNYCPKCMHVRRKHPCADCGVQVDWRAERCMPCWGAAHAGADNPSFKGGRYRMKYHGYISIPGYRGHPRADSNGRVKEHTIVMEKMLGRYLLPNENVHHKNGVRDDNRPENLELWTKSQPAGQRASDMVAWAKELLALYEPEALAQPVTRAA